MKLEFLVKCTMSLKFQQFSTISRVRQLRRTSRNPHFDPREYLKFRDMSFLSEIFKKKAARGPRRAVARPKS